MKRHEHHDESGRTDGFQHRVLVFVDAACSRMGASRRQFGIFALLLAVACTFWARPAGMLIWHRLRIVTGMPRMAVANEDPDVIAQVDFDPPELMDAGRKVELDEALLRDPFLAGSSDGDGGETASSAQDANDGSDDRDHVQLLTGLASQIRLSGTSRGLGSAVLDGRVSVLNAEIRTEDVDYRLVEVRSGAVVVEVSLPDAEQWLRFLLDREGAVLMHEN
jgi:hypothetical protein